VHGCRKSGDLGVDGGRVGGTQSTPATMAATAVIRAAAAAGCTQTVGGCTWMASDCERRLGGEPVWFCGAQAYGWRAAATKRVPKRVQPMMQRATARPHERPAMPGLHHLACLFHVNPCAAWSLAPLCPGH